MTQTTDPVEISRYDTEGDDESSERLFAMRETVPDDRMT